MSWEDPWSPPPTETDSTDWTHGLIGLEELGPEPCDGTGDDAMSMRVRNKWHKGQCSARGALASPQTSSDAARQAADHAAFGEWLYKQCPDDPDAQRLFAMWQLRDELAKRDVLPKETLVDVFNFRPRVELDDWHTVSRKFDESIQCAQPLRPLFTACLIHYRQPGWPTKLYYAAFRVVNDCHRPARCFTNADVSNLITPFFGCLRFCCVESGIHVQNTPIGRAFVDNLKAINKDFHIKAEYDTCELYQTTFAEGVDPYDVITSFPSFRLHIAVCTLASLVKHFGRLDDTLLSSLAARGMWNVRIPDAKEKDIWATVLPKVGGSRITEDGVLDFAFGAYDDDEEGRHLTISLEVPLTPRFFEKLVKACRACKSIHKTEVIIATHRAFDITECKPKMIPRLDDYWRKEFAHRPIMEFHFDDLPELTVRYVCPDPENFYRSGGRIQFWRNGSPTLYDHLLYAGRR